MSPFEEVLYERNVAQAALEPALHRACRAELEVLRLRKAIEDALSASCRHEYDAFEIEILRDALEFDALEEI